MDKAFLISLRNKIQLWFIYFLKDAIHMIVTDVDYLNSLCSKQMKALLFVSGFRFEG